MVAMPSLTAVDSPTFLKIISKTHNEGRKKLTEKLFADCSDRTKTEKTYVLVGPQVATNPGEGDVSVLNTFLQGKEESFHQTTYM